MMVTLSSYIDKPGTWSQKYNLVWDKLLKLQIFGKNVAEETELLIFRSKINMVFRWITVKHIQRPTGSCGPATLANDKATFRNLLNRYICLWTLRLPVFRCPTGIYDDRIKEGFQARSVVGEYYIKMLEEKLIK